jgi:DNA polymerase I-like protein with 3'-5' exonuclease and polymerase domains
MVSMTQPATCNGCALSGLSSGFHQPQVPDDHYGVLLLGDSKMDYGSDLTLTRIIEWAGLDRSRFLIANSVWCVPTSGLLEGQGYEQSATGHCRSQHWNTLLDRVSVVVPMGNVALGALTGRRGILAARGYVAPGPGTTHMVPTVHPTFIRRGQAKYTPAAINDIQKATRLARGGLEIERVDYELDPPPGVAYQWALRYRERLTHDPTIRLAFDIETPGKGEDEAETGDDGDRTFFIHRIGFSYEPLGALSVPWTPEYMPTIRLLLGSGGEKIVWNASFDVPRVRHNGVSIEGVIHDGMVAWHVLHSDLPKGLGFVATFTCPWQPAWKHLSTASPAFYNATDADVELRSMIAIEAELKRTGLWDVYDRDVVKLDPILAHMSTAGMPIDPEVRLDRAIQLSQMQQQALQQMEAAVPQAARRISPKEGYVKAPADTTGLVQITIEKPVRRCERCGAINPTKPHFRTLKRPTALRPQNPCSAAGVVTRIEPVSRWAALEPFRPSKEQLIRYHQVQGRAIPTTLDKKTRLRKPSFDELTLQRLSKQHKEDSLYPAILSYREFDKLAGTYVGRPGGDDGRSILGGVTTGPDQRVHTTFGHNPSSLRLCSFDPNMQNIPRFDPSKPWTRWAKDIFVAPRGHVFVERDFSAIEAVLVGYFAGDPSYIRAAKLGIHAFFAAYKLGEKPDLTDPIACRKLFKAIKKAEANLYDTCKKTVHGSNYRMTPAKMALTWPEVYTSVRMAATDQEMYYGLFPAIPQWHRTLCERVDAARRRRGEMGEVVADPWTLGVGYAQNPYGYVHRFYHVLDWQKVEGEWISSFGEDAKRLISFLPQSTAAAIIKAAARELWYSYPWIGEHMRLLVHDSIIWEAPEREVDQILGMSQAVMEQPRQELPLDPSWGMGEFLSIGSEAKLGPAWSQMEDA